MLNKQSGLKGICGEADVRSVLQMKADGNERAALAVDMYCYRVRKYIGAYVAALEGQVDAVVFSAGIGENSAAVRSAVCHGLAKLGVVLDDGKNAAVVGGASGVISAPDSPIKVIVIPADEELSIAKQTLAATRSAAQR